MAKYWLIVLHDGEKTNVTLPLRKGELLIGRGEKCDVIIPAGKISRRHLIIAHDGDEVTFRDCGSKTGTLLNGKSQAEGSLKPGDQLTIHLTTFVLVDSHKLSAQGEVLKTKFYKDQEIDAKAWKPFATFLERLRSTNSPEVLLRGLLQGLVELFAAERGFVLLKERGTKNLRVVASHRLENRDEFVSISSTVYAAALKEKRVLLIEDSTRNELCLAAPSLYESAPRTILCAPLMAGGKAIGVIYIDLMTVGSEMDDDKVALFESVTSFAAGLLAERRTRKALLQAKERLTQMASLVANDAALVFGESEKAQELTSLIEAAGPKDISVLITGETGAGKEMVARALHQASSRKNGPFVAVNCGALAKDVIEAELFGAEKGAFTGAEEQRIGRFELAAGGTLFLDEVGELPLEVQVTLLRVLEERRLVRVGGNEVIPVDIRLLCATNRCLETAVREGYFRHDLYYRLNVFQIKVPSLRQRPDDITVLAETFLAEAARRFGKKIGAIAPTALKQLLAYGWPGNIRELKNVIERAVVVEKGRALTPASLSLPTLGKAQSSPEDALWENLPLSYVEARDMFERTFLKRCLAQSNGNITDAAKASGMTRCAIYRRLEKLDLLPKDD